MKSLINGLTIVSLFAFSCGLVHHIQMKYKNGTCTGSHDASPLKLWEFKKDDKVCGGIMCHNEKGDALIYYCQKLPSFLDCAGGIVIDTTVPFPECCWKCVATGYCDHFKGKYKRRKFDSKLGASSGRVLAMKGEKSGGKGKEKGDKLKPDNKSNRGSAVKSNDKLETVAKANDKERKEEKKESTAKPIDKPNKGEQKGSAVKSNVKS